MPGRETDLVALANISATATLYFVDELYFVTALVPSETACFANSPGRINRTEV